MLLTCFVFSLLFCVCDVLLHDGLFLSVICALQACYYYDDDEQLCSYNCFFLFYHCYCHRSVSMFYSCTFSGLARFCVLCFSKG